MKGIVLAGGLGTRLFPLTKVTNKHLLPIYDKPMIYYPIELMVDAGIQDILIVTGGKNAGDFLRLLGNGKEFGLKHINYTYQEGEGGIADALSLAEFFADGQPICVILGDNIIEGSIAQTSRISESRRPGADPAERSCRSRALWRCRNSRATGSSALKKNRRSRSPTTRSPASTCLTRRFLKSSRTLKPSHRGELEITDVNNAYIGQGKM